MSRVDPAAAHTGAEADPWRGHVTEDGYAVMGNLVAGEEVVLTMAAAFEASEGETLPERLVRTLEAGQAAGGDKRGKQSAAVTTMNDQPYPYVDLRVDEHPNPIPELRRIYEVFKVQMLPFVEGLPTRKNPEGNLGEEIRGSLIPADDLRQAYGKTKEGLPPPQDLQTAPRGS